MVIRAQATCVDWWEGQRVGNLLPLFVAPDNPPPFRAMKRDVKTVAGWDFERIIPCHGVRAIAASYPIIHSSNHHLPTGRHRERWKKSVEGSVQVVPRLNDLLFPWRFICVYYMTLTEEKSLYDLQRSTERER